MKLALFDFDGTVTTRDTLPDFIKFAVGKAAYYKGLAILSPMLIAYLAKLVPNDVAKERLLGHFFRAWKEEDFRELAEQYGTTQVDRIVRNEAIEKIKWHQEQGHTVVVVSASMEDWVEPWCQQNGLELIATKFGKENGQLTGLFNSKNCYGQEKVNRVKQAFNLADFEEIYAYGDSRGDREMLSLADVSYYRSF